MAGHFSVHADRNAGDRGDLSGLARRSAETRRLTAADTAGVYLSSGWLLWVRAGTLVAQRLDLERKALTGDPVTLADPVAFDAGSGKRRVGIGGGSGGLPGGRGQPAATGLVRPLRQGAGRGGRAGREYLQLPVFRPMAAGWRCPHGAGQYRHLASGRGPHEPLHVRCGSRPLSHLVAGRQPDRVRLEPEGPLATSIKSPPAARARRNCSWNRRRTNGPPTGRPTAGSSSITAAIRKRRRTSGCCRWRATASRWCF